MTRASIGYVGPYRLLNVVNTGQSTQIWQAYHDGKQQMFGVKILLERYRQDREQISYLRREYMVSRQVIHPRFIEIYTYAVDRGTPYLAMEWFAAPNLKQRIQQGTKKIAYLVPRIIEQAAEALAEFHRKGWIHRDIKPDNFLVADGGDVKLIDFSLARRYHRGLARLFSARGKVQGTRSYMAPEQIRGGALDPRADLYSFGCMLHELFAGKPPFTGTSANELLNKHLRAPPPPLEAIDRNVTPEFGQLIRRTLAKKPSGRPQTVDDFIREFHSVRVFKVTPKPPQEVARK